MRAVFLLTTISTLFLLASCGQRNSRFVSMKSSKKAVNYKGSNYEHGQISKQIDQNNKSDNSSRTIMYNQGATGAGSGSSGASMYYARQKLKNTEPKVANAKTDDIQQTSSHPNSIDEYYRKIDRFNYREGKKIYEENPGNYSDDAWWEVQKKLIMEEEENPSETNETKIGKSEPGNTPKFESEKEDWEKEWDKQMREEELNYQ